MGTNPHISDLETKPKKEYHPPKFKEYGEIKKITKNQAGAGSDGVSEESAGIPYPPPD